MPRPHSVRAGSRAQGLPRVSALGKACLSDFARDLANVFRRKEQSPFREPAAPRGSLCKGKAGRSQREGGGSGKGVVIYRDTWLLSKTNCLNRIVLWGKDDHQGKLPSTSQPQPKLLRKPLRTRWRKEKPPVPRTLLTSGCCRAPTGKRRRKAKMVMVSAGEIWEKRTLVRREADTIWGGTQLLGFLTSVLETMERKTIKGKALGQCGSASRTSLR